jgi:hypothetical protein
MRLVRVLPAALFLAATVLPATNGNVTVTRVPNGGIQPDVAVDARGVVHMVYLLGEPGAANVFYVRSRDGGKTFAPAVRVNSQDGSAIATGTIRGAQIALGRDGRIHVAWNGSNTALPKPLVDPKTQRTGMPMLYARSTAAATAFEVQRNLIAQTTNLDGGGSIAADQNGHVYVAWHGNAIDGESGEAARRVWIARSNDDGATFLKEMPISDPSTGVCGCCALRLATTATGDLHLLYRAATALINRDMYSLVSRDRGTTFSGSRVHSWKIATCPMSSMSIAAGDRVWRAWETDGQVYFNSVDSADKTPIAPPPGSAEESRHRKHPRIVGSQDGSRVLLVWTEGTAWARGGSLAWQVFESSGRPVDVQYRETGVPVWSFAAAAARPDGSFVIFY